MKYISEIKLTEKKRPVCPSYAEFFGDHKPSRTIVPTNELHFDAIIEIEAIAYIL